MNLSEHFGERSQFRLILLLPLLLYVAVAVFWHSRNFYGITGDEPHYLLISDSVVRDGDLTIDNNYVNPTPVHQASGVDLSQQIHLGRHTNGRYSFHNVGLPLLLAIPYRLAGVFGAKLLMALLAGLWPLLLYKIFRPSLQSEFWAVTLAILLTAGLPFLGASSQLYPDLLSGLIVLYLTWTVWFRGRADEELAPSPWSDIWIGALIALLPWLHVRFVAPAILLLLANAYFRGTRSGLASVDRRRVLIPVFMVICSLVLLGVYHHIAFNNILGPYGRENATLRLNENLMIFLGFHWDQAQGMFIQQPFLLLGLIGLPFLIKDDPRGAVLLSLLYLSVLAPNATHTAWYGGYSFQGRFWWTVFGLWIFPTIYTLRALLRGNAGLLKWLCLAGVAVQVWYANRWIFQDALLFNRNIPVWATKGFFHHTPLLTRLPTFRDFDSYLDHPANVIATLLGPLLVFTGWLWLRGRRETLKKLWVPILVLGLGTLMLVSPSTGSWKLKASELPSQVGTIEGADRVATEQHGPGAVVFGPYAVLAEGPYQVTIDYDSSVSGEASNARFGAVYEQGAKVLVDVMLPPSNARLRQTKYDFWVSREQSLRSLFEFPVRYTGKGYLRVKELTLTRID